MRYVVTGVHFFGALQIHHGVNGILPLQGYFAQQNIRSSRVWLQQQSLLERLLRLRIVSRTRVSITQSVISASIERIANSFLFKLGNRDVEMLTCKCNLTEQAMRERKLRIELKRFSGKLMSHRNILPA